MTGPEAYRRAVKLAADARTAFDAHEYDWAELLIVEAQVHATLALAAATMHGRVSDRVSPPQAWNEALA
jgi:hypothetical protein